MVMGSSVPAQCVFCHAPGTVEVGMSIWKGAVARCWHCRTCERDWPLSPDEQEALNRRSGGADRRRMTRADRRARKI